MQKVALRGTPAPDGPYCGDKAGRCKKVLSWTGSKGQGAGKTLSEDEQGKDGGKSSSS